MDKKLIVTAAGLLGLAVATLPVAAEQAPAAVKGATASPSSAVGDAAGTNADLSDRAEAMLKKRQEDMLTMHDLMHRIRDVKDPQEKSRLMEQHLQMLRDNRQEMRLHRRPHQRPPMRRGGQGPAADEAEGQAPGDEP